MARVAVVTGGTRGIGAATAKLLHAAGYRVAANYRNDDEAAQTFKRATGIPVYKWDVSLFAACAIWLKQIELDLGPVDVLVNNAGMASNSMLHRMEREQWNVVIDANLNSLFNMCRPVIEGMRARKFGRIINISSISGQKGAIRQTNYAAAKAAQIGFTRALAQENANCGITVNVICPGNINAGILRGMSHEAVEKNIVPFIPIGRIGEPEEIARCVAFLAADESGFITGSTLTVNGGRLMA